MAHGGLQGRPTDHTHRDPSHPTFPVGAWHDRPDSRNGHHLDKQPAGPTQGQGVASVRSQSSPPCPPSSQFSPHPGRERGLETRLPPVAMIARLPPPSGGCQAPGHLSRRLRYQVSRGDVAVATVPVTLSRPPCCPGLTWKSLSLPSDLSPGSAGRQK